MEALFLPGHLRCKVRSMLKIKIINDLDDDLEGPVAPTSQRLPNDVQYLAGALAGIVVVLLLCIWAYFPQ